MSDKKSTKTKENTKVLQSKRRRRRQWLTFMRMIRYGVNNFTRNAWLTIAATAIMTITLLTIFITVAAQNALRHAIDTVSSNVSMSIYLKTDTTQKQVSPVISEIRKLPSVKSVVFIDTNAAKKQVVDQNQDSSAITSAINASTNQLPATIKVTVKDLSNTKPFDNFVSQNQDLKKYINPTYPPSNLGSKREIIDNIAGATRTAQRVGYVASAVFVIIAALIIFNTIRMAIFSRKEEIQMMKLIGADKHFIRGPFVVEAVVYGFIGACFATGLGYAILVLSRQRLSSLVDLQPTIHMLTIYMGFVLLIMILLGALIGIVSSLLATRRYLKI